MSNKCEFCGAEMSKIGCCCAHYNSVGILEQNENKIENMTDAEYKQLCKKAGIEENGGFTLEEIQEVGKTRL